MSARNNNAPSRLLRSEGWDTRVDARLLRASDAWEDSAEFRSHGHALRRLFADLKMDAVLCVENRPSVCVKDGRELSPVEVEVLRRKLWNLGATTLLVVETPHAVDVFSTIAKPLRNDEEGSEAQLTSETIADLESAALALQLEQLIRRVETGAIYRQHQPLFDSKSSVNPNLLSNLREARNLICPTKSKEGYRRAHAFIGRFLFSCYLLDRGIVGPPYLKKAKLPNANDMLELLNAASTRGPETLDALFKVLQRDFNGSLFSDSVDDYSINDAELIYLRRFLSGEDLRTGQLSFFRLYDFSFIPVELISSIYEEFVGAEAEAEAEAGQPRRRAHGLRTQGAYYTPPRLAELAIDVATEGWDTLLDKRCLDPACGSGLFLVILFIRMAEEWRKRNPDTTTRDRYEALMSLLSENLQGVDTHPTACLVTCFSLYLAFLDQMDPKEIIELREALEQDAHKKLLPRILWERKKNRPRPPHFGTVRELDFFAMPAQGEFHLVIGNPPWVSRKSAPSVEQWLFSEDDDPYLRDIPEPEQRQTLFPAGELACAFMWKAGLHVLPQGRVCQVLPSRVFLSNNTSRFQAAWLRHHRIETLWLLADWRFVLFPTADCPCFISRYHPKRDHEELGTFEFITPKVELLDPREALIPVLPEDQKTLSESDIVSAARNKGAAAAWKRQHWGTPRDGRLIERLMRMPRLKGLAKAPPKDPSSIPGNRKRYWFKGQGFRGATESTEKPVKVFWKETHPFLAADTPVLNLILLRKDCLPIGDRYEGEGLDRKRNSLIYEAPLLLINKACTKFLASDFNVLFTDDFLSICAPKQEEDELLFLGAVLSSPLTQYLLFHTTANIGIERDIARVKEILELPFPLPEDMRDPTHSKFILRSCAQRLRNLRDELQEPTNLLRSEHLVSEAQEELYHFVCDYFEICEWERHLIEDTMNVFRPSSTPGSLDSENLLTAKSSTSAHRKGYAETLIQTFRGWTRTKKHLWAEGAVASELNLALITLGIADRFRRYAESPAEDRVKKVIDNIRIAAAHNRTSTFHRLRGFALYEQDRVHILKPLNRRHWTATAALNDADEILTRMMEEGGWHV